MDARIEQLRRNGLKLLNTEMMCSIVAGTKTESVDGLYELRHEGKKWRIAVLYLVAQSAFVLLCGWRKSQRVQPRDIARACMLAREYLDSTEEPERRLECH